MSHRRGHPTANVITQFLRTRSADPHLGLLDDIMRTVAATPQDRPWPWFRPILLPRRALLLVALALLLATMGAIAVGSRLLKPDLKPDLPGSMWPQSSLDEVRKAQELAHAGDPAYTWQVDAGLARGRSAGESQIIVRFLQEGLGWDAFRGSVGGNGGAYAEGTPGSGLFGTYDGVFIRCAAGRTNPLYPDDPKGRGCAPTIDDFRYETVKLQVAQLGEIGLSGIWVVARWEMLPPSNLPMTRGEESFSQRQIEQVAPITDAKATALLQAFLQARIDGDGAQELLSYPADGEIPLLYATTNGSPYERSKVELLEGPVWPLGRREYKVQLFAEGGETVVEQFFAVAGDDIGRPMVELSGPPASLQAGTTENGQAVPVEYSFLDGEVTFGVAYPWDTYQSFDLGGPDETTLTVNNNFEERVVLLANPLPVEIGCEQGPAPADAEALARTIRSDPDLEATAPVAVSVGGINALGMDVVLAADATICAEWGTPQVVTPNDHDWHGVALDHGERMRLFLLDLPEGASTRILVIAIVAPEVRFEGVLEATAPIVDSFEFHAP